MTFKKITKPTAKKMYLSGKTIYLVPNKCSPTNDTWVQPTPISARMGKGFETVVNEYEYYNCNYECGKVAAYYIEQEG